jgi:putative ABC transport system permease protein
MKRRMFADADGQQGRVERQVVLPFVKSVEMAFRSIRVRFFRSLITVLSLVLAVSFLSFTDVSTDVANGMLASGIPEWRQNLLRAGYDVAPQAASIAGSPKQRWIIFLSLLVCTVGIVNAQLMAVTERFREIGTMKCLGALDRFVLRLFFLEAGMQGAAGAAAGALAGGLVALLGAWARFGGPAVAAVPAADVLLSLAGATTVGILLSLAGVLYPAWVASRMQPVEAMRVEQ